MKMRSYNFCHTNTKNPGNNLGIFCLITGRPKLNGYGVRIQIFNSIITYCLVAIAHHDMNWSDKPILQILCISLSDKIHLQDQSDKTNCNNMCLCQLPQEDTLWRNFTNWESGGS